MKIALLATGGTIAGVGEPGETHNYTSGVLSAEKLLQDIPEISQIAEVVLEQICNINSDDITHEIWIFLSNRVNAYLQRDDIDGVVITHGTDTMDETAFFLWLTSLAYRYQKPVVLTGAMLQSTAKIPDGPRNLLGAIQSCQNLIGVYVYFAGRLMDARSVQKLNATELDAFGTTLDPSLMESQNASKALPSIHFEVQNLKSLPKVSVLYFNVDADPLLLEYASKISEGVVIAGAGAGEMSESWMQLLENIKKPVVVSSRINQGMVPNDKVLPGHAIPSNDLPPQKAAVLLRLALSKACCEGLPDYAERIRECFKKV